MSSSQKFNRLVVDIGGTKTAVGQAGNGEITVLARFPTPSDPDEAVRQIVETVNKCTKMEAMGAIGIGGPGPLDAVSGRFLSPPNLPGWHDFPFAQYIEEQLGIPARLNNDANLGALGEALYGSGKGFKSIFYLTISTGIGAGFILDGHIHEGFKTMAGEIWAFKPGLFSGQADGSTVMQLASGPGLIEQAQMRIAEGQTSVLESQNLDAPALIQAAMDGDELCVQVLDDGRNAVAALLVAVIQTIAPHRVVLGGGLCRQPQWYVDPIRRKIQKWVGIPLLSQTPVCRAQFWDDAVLYGAAALVRDLIPPIS